MGNLSNASILSASSTLETPSHLLSSARRFYNESDDLISKIESRYYGRTHGAKLILELAEKMTNNGLSRLKENHQLLAEELRESGVALSVQ